MSEKISPEEFFEQFAHKYDDALQDKNYHAQHLNEAVKIFHRHNDYSNGKVLDIGCGTGFLRELLQGDFEYTGIDVSGKMLDYAVKRGYKTIHQPIEVALAKINDQSSDFVFCLGSLLYVEDALTSINHMRRIARKTILISLDETTQEYTESVAQKLGFPVYDHSQFPFDNAIEDYFIVGWTSPTTGISVRTRMIYLENTS